MGKLKKTKLLTALSLITITANGYSADDTTTGVIELTNNTKFKISIGLAGNKAVFEGTNIDTLDPGEGKVFRYSIVTPEVDFTSSSAQEACSEYTEAEKITEETSANAGLSFEGFELGVKESLTTENSTSYTAKECSTITTSTQTSYNNFVVPNQAIYLNASVADEGFTNIFEGGLVGIPAGQTGFILTLIQPPANSSPASPFYLSFDNERPAPQLLGATGDGGTYMLPITNGALGSESVKMSINEKENDIAQIANNLNTLGTCYITSADSETLKYKCDGSTAILPNEHPDPTDCAGLSVNTSTLKLYDAAGNPVDINGDRSTAETWNGDIDFFNSMIFSIANNELTYKAVESPPYVDPNCTISSVENNIYLNNIKGVNLLTNFVSTAGRDVKFPMPINYSFMGQTVKVVHTNTSDEKTLSLSNWKDDLPKIQYNATNKELVIA